LRLEKGLQLKSKRQLTPPGPPQNHGP